MTIKTHYFNTDIANLFGMECATLLQHFGFWISHNIANRRNYKLGNYWTFNSYRAFSELFTYWSQGQIRNIIKNLKKYDLIIENEFNKSGFDKTKWYALTPKALKLLDIKHPDLLDQEMNNESSKAFNLSICQNQQMGLSKSTNGSVKINKPIPNINTDINTDSSSSLYITSARAHEDVDLEKQKTAAAPKNISSTEKPKELSSPPPEPVSPPPQQPEVESFSTLTESITPNLDLTTTYTRPYNPYYVKTQVLADEECIRIHKEKNLGLKRTLEEEFDYCVEYRRAKNQPTGLLEFKVWLGRARAEIMPSTTLKIDSMGDEQSILQDLYLMESKPAMYGNLLTTEQHKRAVAIRDERNKMRTTRPEPQPSRSPAPIRLADLLKNAPHQSSSSGALYR